MNIMTLSIMTLDLFSIGVIFWFIPDAVARLLKGRLHDSGPRPIRFMVDQLPGLVVGTVFGALVLYLTGVSYENFIVNTGRSVGNAALELVGMDKMTICTKRVITEHFPTTSESQFRQEASRFRNSLHPTPPTRDNILMRGQGILMLGQNQTNVMERAAQQHCNFRIERGLFER